MTSASTIAPTSPAVTTVVGGCEKFMGQVGIRMDVNGQRNRHQDPKPENIGQKDPTTLPRDGYCM